MTVPITAFGMLADALRPLIPAAWHFVGYEDSIDDPDRVTVIVKLSSVQRFPAAPEGAYRAEWVVTIIDPHTDPAKADPFLFDALIDFLDDLDTAPDLEWLGWTSAEKVLDSGRFAFDITIHTITRKPRE
jgi:hypothetical protein